MRQFYVSHVSPSVHTEKVVAVLHDRDCHRFVEFPPDVEVLGEDRNGNPIVRFPKRKLVFGNVLDSDR